MTKYYHIYLRDPNFLLALAKIINVIKQANGQAVLAHPLKYGLNNIELNELISAFKQLGGAGIEMVSGKMLNNQVSQIVEYCNRYHLLASTGLDYHSHS